MGMQPSEVGAMEAVVEDGGEGGSVVPVQGGQYDPATVNQAIYRIVSKIWISTQTVILSIFIFKLESIPGVINVRSELRSVL